LNNICNYPVFRISILIVLLFLSNTSVSFAQKNGSYFQQEVNYFIDVSLNDKLHSISGNMYFDYINNSPDTLFIIQVHIGPNAYRNNETPLVKQQLENGLSDLFFAKDFERGFMDSLKFTSAGKYLEFKFHAVDYGTITLNEPLLPGGHVKIATPFYVKLPSARFSRLGHKDQAYYISQWYPKPAVYDRAGWHAMSYLDIGEFYSEFGSFEVHITLPSNYVVCATGELQNKEEEAWLNLKASVTGAGNNAVGSNEFPTSELKNKTLVYKQSNIHDFAWFADKRFVVQKGSVLLPNSGRRIDTWAFYLPASARLWKHSIDYVNRAIIDYSTWNGDYIYSSCSVAEGALAVSVGMEYPMVALLKASDTLNLATTIIHEVGHNWFYGMLGSNERDHPWLDEGLNSFNQLRCQENLFGSSDNSHVNDLTPFGKTAGRLFGIDAMKYSDIWHLEYLVPASTGDDQPAILPATDYTWLNYGAMVYRKSAVVFNYLRHYLGDELFDACMKEYFQKWSLKHPQPSDLRRIFDEKSGKDLSWFFDGLLNSTGVVDYKISIIKNEGTSNKITIKNRGTINSPIWLQGIKNDSVITSVLIDGFSGIKEIESSCAECTSYNIDYLRYTPDINRNNNNIYTKGILKKRDPFSIGLLPKLNPSNGNRLCIFPSVAWNEYNKWMPGLTFYNKTVPVKKLEFAFTALYGTGDNEPAGLGSVAYNIYPEKGLIDHIGMGISAKRFAYEYSAIRTGKDVFEKEKLHYSRLEPGLELRFRESNPRSLIQNKFFLSMITLNEQSVAIKRRVIAENYNITCVESSMRTTFRGVFAHTNNRILDPYSLFVNLEGNNKYQKFSLTANYLFKYANKSKGVSTRFFAGYQLYDKTSDAYPFYLNGWSGVQDFWYDDLYFGRSERTGFSSQQMSMRDGGFKTSIPYSSTIDWLISGNINVDFPGGLPISFFIDAGTFKDAKDLLSIYDVKGNLIYDAGICISVLFAKVYFPVFRSADIKAYQSGDFGIDKILFREQIRFEINLNKVNPFYIRNQLLKL
jgi:Peptidase family M1 domain